MTSTATPKPQRLPFFDGILPIDTARIPSEAIAGATLAALAIPETMGYASMAQMPVITGLYTLLIPVFLFAILGSSRHLVVAADSATAITIAAGLTGLGLVGGSTEWIAMMGLAALMVAAILLLARVLKLGFLAYFLSRSVLVGFLTGVGIQVAMGQLAGVLGVPKPSGGTLEQFVATLRLIPQADLGTVAVAVDRLGRDPRQRSAEQEDPGRAHRGRRDDRHRLPRDPAGIGQPPRSGPGWAAAVRRAAGRHHDRQRPGTPADRAVVLPDHPRPERRDLERVRDEVPRQLRRERRPDRPGRGQRRRRPVGHLDGERQPDEDRDGRQRRRSQPARPGDRGRSCSSCCCS